MAAPVDPDAEKRGLSCLAHEFANLLQVVNGNLELLEAHVSDQPARRYLANARSAADQLAQLSRLLSTKICDQPRDEAI
jgi:signal transduction histidine kinase